MSDVTTLQERIAKKAGQHVKPIALTLTAPAAAVPTEALNPENPENAVVTPAAPLPGGFVPRPIPHIERRISIRPGTEPGDQTLTPEAYDRVARGEERIEAILSSVVEADPEGRATLRRENERLKGELKSAYAELGAERRAHAGGTRHPGAGFYERMGQGLEQDAETLADLVDRYPELPEELREHLTAMARNQSQFAVHCVAFAATLQ